MQIQSLTELFDKKMSRKQFLQTVGLIALTIAGLGAIAKLPQDSKNQISTKSKMPNHLYGK